MIRILYTFIGVLFLIVIAACKQQAPTDLSNSQENKKEMTTYKTIGNIERIDSAIDKLISNDAKIEILASGFVWSEGPVWVGELDALLFCDIPPNRIHMWKEGMTEASVYLSPSGYTSDVKRGGEVGSNGLIVNKNRELVLCQHGDRRIASLDAPWDAAKPNYQTIADKFEGKRFNSPNDIIQKSNGDYYFTDPPYGLEFQMKDPAKEIDYQGVFKCDVNGEVTLLTKTMTRPNGLAFSPDEKTLYVANSDPAIAVWNAFDVEIDGSITNERVFYDATGRPGKGLPDGMKIDKEGNIFATGPGGVYIMDSAGKLLGVINTTEATSNCAFGGKDNDYLYMTCDMHLMRIKLSTSGAI